MGQYKSLSFSELKEDYEKILTDEANDFFIHLNENFSDRRKKLIDHRNAFAASLHKGASLGFLEETKDVRTSSWRVADIPQELLNRQVEITGPVDRKMIINGLNSKAMVYMADFEDSQSPTWSGVMEGQINLYDAVRKEITFTNPQGKEYKLNPEIALLMVRPRGLHLDEKNVLFNGELVSASLFDFAYYFFHNVHECLKQERGIYFYIPKLEHHQEAMFWQEVFAAAEKYFDLPQGTIRVTVLIETITAVFEMHEILYHLKNYCVGLNCGRWDYIFSYIKKQSHLEDKILPNRDQVNMGTHFLRSYSKLLIATCHKRGALAMGGMAAQIPIKNDEEKNDIALNKVREDKEREAQTGHDGTWVAHPGLVGMVKGIFSNWVSNGNQLNKMLPEADEITSSDLLAVPEGEITLAGMKDNIEVSIHYLAAWLSGNGCVPINNLMEDLATAEISRAQLWQWVHRREAKLSDGQAITKEFFEKTFDSILNEFKNNPSLMIVGQEYYFLAGKILKELILKDTFTDFLSSSAYHYLK